MLGFGMSELVMIAVILGLVLAIVISKNLSRKSSSASGEETSQPTTGLLARSIIIIAVIVAAGACFKFIAGDRVDDKKMSLARELAERMYKNHASFGFGALNPTVVNISRMDVVDIGERSDKALPVKFQIQGDISTFAVWLSASTS